MASIDTLPPDQRAVLDLVLRRGRSYDDIARLLQIDRAGVRARALAAFDELGPDTGLAPEARALITDYLLGQLPTKVAEQTRDRLATSPYERAWARVLASELAPVSSEPLPEIPEGTARAKAPAADAPAKADGTKTNRSADKPRRVPRPGDRPSSRLGGAIFLLVGAIVVVVVVVVLIVVLSSGGSNKASGTTAAQSATTTSAQGTTTGATTGTGTGTTTGTTSTTAAKIVAQVNLDPPSGTGNAKGAAFVVKAGTAHGIIVEAQGLAANSHNAYAVWLSNSPTDSVRVGFVNTPVGKNGKLQTEGALPTNAAHYKNLLLTLETSASPKTPGQVVLQGTLKGLTS
ncbi:MAG TPA: sigma factor-like helix-turn-helix DNA-binding protein [Solirubrobacteraceae bacterium]|nr:sigma factor-like helix-turn-helix DNA-binding protein [Solirubrobacteraceae bacterium]